MDQKNIPEKERAADSMEIREEDKTSAERIAALLQNRQAGRIGEEKVHHASVLIPLLEREDGSLELLFEERSAELNGQPGDICFPGGMAEPGETPEETAVRETCEELLISEESIKLLGPADVLDHGTLMVHPFAGKLLNYKNSFSRDEVKQVFTVPLNWFLSREPERHRVEWKPVMDEDFPFDKIFGGKDYAWRQRRETILFYEYQGHVIWGMTARILDAFLAVLKQYL